MCRKTTGRKERQEGFLPAIIRDEIFKAHNTLRAKHDGTPPLRLSKSMSKYAEAWAKVMANSGTLRHRNACDYGENLYMGVDGKFSGEKIVQKWYDEIRKYDYKNPLFQVDTGRFTQVIWKNSKELGIGIARRGDCIFVVCNYDPPGNMMGQFPENVKPLRKKKNMEIVETDVNIPN